MIKTQQFKKKYHDVFINSSSGPIQNEVLTIISEHPSSSKPTLIHLIKLKKQEEELIKFKEEHHDELRKFSSGPIHN